MAKLPAAIDQILLERCDVSCDRMTTLTPCRAKRVISRLAPGDEQDR
jgi:hypothetical protein